MSVQTDQVKKLDQSFINDLWKYSTIQRRTRQYMNTSLEIIIVITMHIDTVATGKLSNDYCFGGTFWVIINNTDDNVGSYICKRKMATHEPPPTNSLKHTEMTTW